MAKLNPAPLGAQKWEFFSATDKKNSEGQFSRKIQCNVLTFDKSKPPGGIYYVYIQRRRKSFVHSILKERGFGKQLPEPAKIRWEEGIKSQSWLLFIPTDEQRDHEEMKLQTCLISIQQRNAIYDNRSRCRKTFRYQNTTGTDRTLSRLLVAKPGERNWNQVTSCYKLHQPSFLPKLKEQWFL